MPRVVSLFGVTALMVVAALALSIVAVVLSIQAQQYTSVLAAREFTDGQLLIGNSATQGQNINTLVEGDGLNVTNGHGTIALETKEATEVVIETPGAFNVTVPEDAVAVRVSLSGGGGGGGGGANDTEESGGCGGGSSAYVHDYLVFFSSRGTLVNITGSVGTGGDGGAVETSGSNGEDTEVSIGALVTLTAFAGGFGETGAGLTVRGCRMGAGGGSNSAADGNTRGMGAPTHSAINGFQNGGLFGALGGVNYTKGVATLFVTSGSSGGDSYPYSVGTTRDGLDFALDGYPGGEGTSSPFNAGGAGGAGGIGGAGGAGGTDATPTGQPGEGAGAGGGGGDIGGAGGDGGDGFLRLLFLY